MSVGDDDDKRDHTHLLQLAIQEKYSNKDVKTLTKMEIDILMKMEGLKEALKNMAGICARCIRQQLVFHSTLQDLWQHVKKK